MRLKTTREKRILYFKTTLRIFLYGLIVMAGFIYMTCGTWTKAVVLVPTAVCVALNADVLVSAFVGAFCGFLIDIACERLFGYNAVLLAVFCAAISLVYELYFRKRFFNYLWITALAAFLQCRLDYEFYYKMWNYENVERIFHTMTLKVWGYTMISAVIIYIIFAVINKFLMPKAHLTLEDVIKTS